MATGRREKHPSLPAADRTPAGLRALGKRRRTAAPVTAPTGETPPLQRTPPETGVCGLPGMPALPVRKGLQPTRGGRGESRAPRRPGAQTAAPAGRRRPSRCPPPPMLPPHPTSSPAAAAGPARTWEGSRAADASGGGPTGFAAPAGPALRGARGRWRHPLGRPQEVGPHHHPAPRRPGRPAPRAAPPPRGERASAPAAPSHHREERARGGLERGLCARAPWRRGRGSRRRGAPGRSAGLGCSPRSGGALQAASACR